jgi:hypothetical protein
MNSALREAAISWASRFRERSGRRRAGVTDMTVSKGWTLIRILPPDAALIR